MEGRPWGSYGMMVLAVMVCALPLSSCQECPVPHTCQGFGLEPLSSGTGEAAFCLGAGATPICPGVDVDGNILASSTSTTPASTTTTTTMSTSTPTPSTPVSPSNTPPTTTTTPGSPSTTTTTTSTAPQTSTTTTPPQTTTTPNTTPPTVPLTTPTTTTPAPCQEADCSGKSVGVYAHPNCDCQKYYICERSVLGGENLILSLYRCTGGKVFDPVTSQCVTSTANCPKVN